MKNLAQTIDLISDVLYYLSDKNAKARVIEKMFPEAQESYKQEWVDREPFVFWSNLSHNNKCLLVKYTATVRNQSFGEYLSATLGEEKS